MKETELLACLICFVLGCIFYKLYANLVEGNEKTIKAKTVKSSSRPSVSHNSRSQTVKSSCLKIGQPCHGQQAYKCCTKICNLHTGLCDNSNPPPSPIPHKPEGEACPKGLVPVDNTKELKPWYNAQGPPSDKAVKCGPPNNHYGLCGTGWVGSGKNATCPMYSSSGKKNCTEPYSSSPWHQICKPMNSIGVNCLAYCKTNDDCKDEPADCSECIDGQCASPHIVPPILPKSLKKCSTIVNGEIHKGYIYNQDFSISGIDSSTGKPNAFGQWIHNEPGKNNYT